MKEKTYVLAIDAGTGSGRAVLFDQTGRQCGVGQQEWTHRSDPRYPGSMDFLWCENYAILCNCIKMAMKEANVQASAIKAVSATSMREGIVLYDKQGVELWACANVDSRAADEVRTLQQDEPDLERDAYCETGQTFALGAVPRLKWIKHHMPDVYEKVAIMSMLSDWILARLSGVIASDPSNAGTTGLFSLHTREWCPGIARRAGLKDSIFPPVVETGTKIGEVSVKAAGETGLVAGTAVVMGGGDVQLGSLGLGVVRPGQGAVLGGTFWQEVVNMGQAVTHPDMRIRINPHVTPGVSQSEGIAFMIGMTTRWFRDAFCQEEKRLAAERGIDAYMLLEEMAAQIPPGSYGIIPIFSDVMNYGAWYHAAPSLLNLPLDPKRGGKAAVFRAIQENAAVVAAQNLELAAQLAGTELDDLVFAGGASKGALWCQILADVTGKSVKIPEVTEATALAAGLAAWVGIGRFSSLEDAAERTVRWKRYYTPNRTLKNLYHDQMARWREAYTAQRTLVDRHITESMWKAPGL